MVRKPTRLPVEALLPYLLDVPGAPPGVPLPPPPGGAVHWPGLFGNDHPVEIEVGVGKGLFLVSTAPTRPGTNFLGVEIVRKYVMFTANRIAKRGLANVRLACADVRRFLPVYVRAGSVDRLHVYFPDPWWKNRHRKRRLFDLEFAREAVRIVRPGGNVLLATDVPNYATMVRSVAARVPELQPVPDEAWPGPECPGTADGVSRPDYLSNYERKAALAGSSVHRVGFVRL